ncbi:MAG TPA: DUF6665 family protein [Xanthobacteraceae bacterium]|nr:DUF6665 family protein [Xanthobacteraceae bacterium]
MRAENPVAALDYEIAREKASALGRLGRRLEAALAALAAFDAQADEEASAAPAVRRERRAELVAAAGEVLWSFIVQREACGLRDSSRAMRDYAVPAEVRLRAWAFSRRRNTAWITAAADVSRSLTRDDGLRGTRIFFSFTPTR